MRRMTFLLCLVLLGCVSSKPVKPDDALPADLRTRSDGSDWPRFLGPLGTSVSTENGIISPWPKDGPRILWHKEVGPGYGMPTISKGKLYHFDRAGMNLRRHPRAVSQLTSQLRHAARSSG